MSSSRRRWLALAVVPSLLVVATAAAVVAMRPHLPDPVAVHFGPDGRADGFRSTGDLVLMAVGIQAVTAAVMSAIVASAGRHPIGGRALLGLPAAVVGFVGGVAVGSVLGQRGLETATTATLAGWVLPAAFVVAGTAGAVAALVGPRPAVVAPAVGGAPAHAPRTDLGGGAGVWRGTTRSSPALAMLAALVLVPGLAATWAGGGATGLVLPLLLLPLLAVAASARFSVVIGPTGVRVRGVMGWPRTHVPLDVVSGASVEDVRPMAYGGWGWRLRQGRTAVITSAGPGLVVTRSDGMALVVTLDDAEEAAGVVNGLVDRREAARAADPA